jgi:hypothetical protein
MKTLSFILIIIAASGISFGQSSITKQDLYGTWRACGDVNWDDEADTLVFQKPTPGCREFNCGEHDWSFRESGTVEFIFTSGCDTGFNSKSKNSKKWMFYEGRNRLMFITNDGYKEHFDVLEVGDKLILVHRKDLED